MSRTDVLVSAVGQLSRPSIPRLPGLDTFSGPAFHSAEWQHDVAPLWQHLKDGAER